jgi:CspA family cold shock protein
LFVHKADIEGFINEGDKVEFEIGEGEKGPNATNVKKIE